MTAKAGVSVAGPDVDQGTGEGEGYAETCTASIADVRTGQLAGVERMASAPPATTTELGTACHGMTGVPAKAPELVRCC